MTELATPMRADRTAAADRTAPADRTAAADRTAPERDLRVAVGRVESVADQVVALSLRHPGGDDLPAWSPGAHIDLCLGPDLVRQYSLCGNPDRLDEWHIAVLLEPAGRGGSVAVHALRPGDVVEVRGPRNHFALEPAPRYLFIAGGIGITPIRAMLAQAERAGADWRLVYGGRTRTSMAFREELAVEHPGRVALCPQDECGLLELASLLAEPRPHTLVYCCGPEPLLAAVEHTCTPWPAGALHVERFSAKPVTPEDTEDDITHEVEFRASGITVEVPPDDSILEAAERAGLPVDSSCHEGICGTCEVAVLEGDPVHRDAVLNAAERESGEVMMICCSRARSRRLVLDL
jgi:ferredoxin-NADP reductase